MKKGYISHCTYCDFKTNEKNKSCPICNHEMNYIFGEDIKDNPTLPEKISNENHKHIEMGYHCFKCRKKIKTKVCLDCNNVGSLYLEYASKKAIIKRINRLTDVYSQSEMDVILKELTPQEKMYIYHNYESAYKFFYKKDTNKSIACIVFAFIFYFVLLDITFNMNENSYLVASYLFNMLSNTILVVMLSLGVWYLIDATNVEFAKIPIKIGLLTFIPNLVQTMICIMRNASIKWMLISGYICMFITIVINVVYIIWELKREK